MLGSIRPEQLEKLTQAVPDAVEGMARGHRPRPRISAGALRL